MPITEQRRRRPHPTLPLFAVLLLAVSACAGESRARVSEFPANQDLQMMLRYLVEDGETPGIVVGLLEADGSTRVLSHGSGGPRAQPLGSGSVFEIGSVTKTFTGTLLADMVARGEASLDDPVSRYLPDSVSVPAFEGREITLLDLATHTSGLPGAPDHRPADPLNPWADWTIERLYTWLSDYELARAPGAEYEYSNVGMGLLGHALSRAAAAPLSQLMEQRIFEPLGMRSTGYGADGGETPSLVTGHQLRDTVPHWTETEAIGGAGGLRSSAEDLLRYLEANIGPPGSDLERAMRSAHEPRRPEGPGEERIGLAWITAAANGHTIVRHSGGTGGFRAELAFDPERGVGIVVLANSSTYNDNLGMVLIAAGPPPSMPEVDVAAETLESYTGSYRSSSGLPLYVDVDTEGHLTGQAPSQTRFRLHATSDSTFYAKRVPFELTFNRSGEGEVEDLVLAVGPNTNRFERIGDEVPRSAVIAGHELGTITAEAIARYEGTYDVEIQGQPMELRVYGEADRLMANLGNQTVSRLLPRGEHEFVPAANLQARVVFEVVDGRAQTVTLTQNGQTVTGERRR